MLKDIRLQKIFRNFATSEIKVADGAPRTLVVKISTPTPDRSRDTVQPAGMDASNFLKNPVVLYAHDYSSIPIAKCTSLKASDTGVIATVQFPAEGTYDVADTIYEMYKQGFLNAWSIGFMPTDYDENTEGGYNFKNWELFEFSSVPVPDNPEALTIMRSKGINVDIVTEEKKDDSEPSESEKKISQVVEDFKKSMQWSSDTSEEVKTIVLGNINGLEEKLKKELIIKDADDPADETPITDINVGQLRDLILDCVNGDDSDDDDTEKGVQQVVAKDVSQIVALGYLLDEMKYFIQCFAQMGVNQASLDKMTQALALIMDVVKEQAIIGEKTIKLPSMMKTGRAISAKHEEMLKAACGHMTEGMKAVQTVLDTVAEQAEEEDEKGVNTPLSKKLYSQIAASKEQFKKADKEIGLTLRLFKTIEGTKGGEK